MQKFKTLYKGKFVDLISPLKDTYECINEKDNVIILPLREGKLGIRLEYCPPYWIKDINGEELYYTVISGGKDEKDVKETALRELKEESGVTVTKGKVYRLYENIGFVKNTDCRSSLVFVNIKEYEEEKPKGDGTINEKKSKTIWVTKKELDEILTKKNIDSLLFFCSSVMRLIWNKQYVLSWVQQTTYERFKEFYLANQENNLFTCLANNMNRYITNPYSDENYDQHMEFVVENEQKIQNVIVKIFKDLSINNFYKFDHTLINDLSTFKLLRMITIHEIIKDLMTFYLQNAEII